MATTMNSSSSSSSSSSAVPSVVVVVGTTVFPGDVLVGGGVGGGNEEYQAGLGCYVWKDGTIRSSLCGKVVVSTGGVNNQGKPIISVSAGNREVRENIIVGDSAYCQVLKINVNQAIVNITFVGDNALSYPPKGIIRREDVAGSSDTVAMYQYFRPGDIVRAEIVSLGDSRYYLSTDGDDLGVFSATSQQGNRMVVSGPQVSENVFLISTPMNISYGCFPRRCKIQRLDKKNQDKYRSH
jgi:exosome complex component CSL4